MRVTVVPLGGLQSAADRVEFLLRLGSVPSGLFSEGVQDITGGFEPDCVDGPEGVALVARDDLQNAGAEPLRGMASRCRSPSWAR